MIKNRLAKKILNKSGSYIEPCGTPNYISVKCLNYFQFLFFVFYSASNHALNVMVIKANKDYCRKHSIWL